MNPPSVIRPTRAKVRNRAWVVGFMVVLRVCLWDAAAAVFSGGVGARGALARLSAMKSPSWPVLTLFATLACSAPPTTSGPPSAADLRVHLSTLADDAMQGRRAASAGGRAAADYLVGVFERAGLQPGGADGSWFQPIDVVGHAVESAGFALLTDAGRRELLPGRDLSPMSWGELSGVFEILRVTSIDELPETPRADTALLLDGGDPRSSWILSRRLPDGGSGWGCVLLGHSEEEGEPGEFSEDVSVRGSSAAKFWVRGEALTILREQRDARFSAEVRLSAGQPARNVLGVVRAAERSAFAESWVLVTAHYDHLGMLDDDAEGDRVYNGANDNASGVAVLLEWAEAVAAGPAPARNVLFMPVTAEELGLVGSSYYAENPTVPLEDIAAVVNIEMLGEPDALIGGSGKMFLTGFELSDMGAAWAAADVPVTVDPRPELNLYFRSDNAPFARLGVVAHTLSSGGANETYHKVGDELATVDFEHLEVCAREGLRGLRLLLSGELSPRQIIASAEQEDAASDD